MQEPDGERWVSPYTLPVSQGYVYALLDPRDRLVYYVGITTLDVRTRYIRHCAGEQRLAHTAFRSG
jgi:hypothetical protein